MALLQECLHQSSSRVQWEAGQGRGSKGDWSGSLGPHPEEAADCTVCLRVRARSRDGLAEEETRRLRMSWAMADVESEVASFGGHSMALGLTLKVGVTHMIR